VVDDNNDDNLMMMGADSHDKNALVGFEDGQLADGFAANFNQINSNSNMLRIVNNQHELAAVSGNLFKRFGASGNGNANGRQDEIKVDLLKI
jgi:hypothetical protein